MCIINNIVSNVQMAACFSSLAANWDECTTEILIFLCFLLLPLLSARKLHKLHP